MLGNCSYEIVIYKHCSADWLLKKSHGQPFLAPSMISKGAGIVIDKTAIHLRYLTSLLWLNIAK